MILLITWHLAMREGNIIIVRLLIVLPRVLKYLIKTFESPEQFYFDFYFQKYLLCKMLVCGILLMSQPRMSVQNSSNALF